MDGWGMVALYAIGAGALALLATKSRLLRRYAGWGRFGAKNRPDSIEGAQAAVLASIGTGRAAQSVGKWRVFRPSIGTRLLPFALGAVFVYQYLYQDAPTNPLNVEIFDLPREMFLAIMALVAASCGYVLRNRVATNGAVLKVRGLLRERRYALDRLREIEEDGVHSYRLTFTGGQVVEIMKTVEGAAELRQMLAHRMEQNLGG